MDIRIFALVAFIAVLGSFTEARSVNFAHGGLRVHRPLTGFATMSRLKREIDGESTTNQATTTTSSTTDTTTPPSTTPPSSTTPSTEPTTTPTTTTEATTPTTTPTTTSDSTTPTTPLTTPTTPSTTSAPSTTTESTTPQPKSDIQSRSNTDEPEDPNKKPGPSPKDDKAPTPGPNFGAPGPNFGAPGLNFRGFGFDFDGFGKGLDPYFSGYPGYPQNSVPGYSPNYAWTGTNNGPGYASAGASAGSFGYPGMGYPMGTFPTVGSPTAFPTFPTAFPTFPTFPTYPTYPTFPTGSPMGSPSFNSRGGFPDTSPNQPNQDNSPKKENLPNQIGYNFGGDPFAGPGFFPGQFPGFNDPTFDMIKQIQAQIEAQRAMAGNYGGGQPNFASASIGLGPYGGFQSGQISPASPGIESRFAEELPAPSGNSFGTFASSSSSSSTGPDGEQINHKSSITGVNDNGKISFRTVYD